MTYNTTSKRIYGSAQILDDIADYESQWSNFLKTEGMSMAQFIVDDNPVSDGYNRQIMLDCLDTIFGNCDEAFFLDGYSYKTNRWTALTTVDLNRYVPYDTVVEDSSGNQYSSYIKDLYSIWEMAKPYSYKRDEWLTKKGLYDDGYIRQRKIVEQTKKYTSVINDASVSKDNWGNITLRKSYKTVLEDTSTREWNTSEDPIDLPTVNDLKNLVYRDKNQKSFLSLVSQAESFLTTIDAQRVSYPWYSSCILHGSYIDGYNTAEVTIIGSKSFVDNIMETCPDYLFFEDANHVNSAATTVVDKITGETNKALKPEIENRYTNSSEAIKAEVFDDPEFYDFYHDCDYYITLKLHIDSNNISNYSASLIPQPTVNFNSLIPYSKELMGDLWNCLSRAYGVFNRISETAKEYELDPVNNYPKYIKILEDLKDNITNNPDACLTALRKVCGEMKTFAEGRARALFLATTNEKNAAKFINCIKARLNKTHGSFMQCYGNLLGLDAQYKKLTCQAGLIDTSGLLVSKAKADSSDPNAFINLETNPDYIDIEPEKSEYFGNRKFRQGDAIYIIGDGCVEFKAVVKSAQVVYLTESDFQNAEQKTDGSINNILTKTVKAVRLYLNSKLPDYYCKNCDTANIRVMKLT